MNYFDTPITETTENTLVVIEANDDQLKLLRKVAADGGCVVARTGTEDDDAGWVVSSVHESQSEAEEVAGEGEMVFGFRYVVSPSTFMIAELDPEYVSMIVEGDFDDIEDAEERIEDVSCRGVNEPCGKYSADGEGYDGLCGLCMDIQEDDTDWESDSADDSDDLSILFDEDDAPDNDFSPLFDEDEEVTEEEWS